MTRKFDRHLCYLHFFRKINRICNCTVAASDKICSFQYITLSVKFLLGF